MKPEYMEAFSEIYEIFKLMPQELLNKIPNKFYEMIEEERDKGYIPNIHEPLENQKLRDETIIILGLIYRDFLCPLEERKKLQAKDARELQELQEQIENELREKYNPDDIFKNRNKKVENEFVEQNKENSLVVIQEDKWYKRIFNLIKKFFNKGN